MTFSAGACLDLGAFDPARPDCGVDEYVARAERTLSWVVVMEDRQPIFFHGYQQYDENAPVPLNRHGPRKDAWRMQDLRRLVAAFHRHRVKVLLGYWTHECSFVDDRHPELMIRDATGELWQDRVAMNADFSPLRRMHADPDHGVIEGERYATWATRQFAKLAHDFSFDGLFLGDGAMGFRRHGHDWKDLRHFDYHEDWLAEFGADHAFARHEGCLVGAGHGPAVAADVQEHHWEHWVAFNTERWTDHYRTTCEGVHALGGIVAAYNVMNYDPQLARQHGVDYRAIAEAGLDILVFQAYDYAWGPLGPFGSLDIEKKDIETNVQMLLRTRAHIGHDVKTKIVVTVETEDEVETWDAPIPHTLGELYHYGNAVSHDGRAWRRAADGAFVVWGNSVSGAEWRGLATAFDALSAAPHAPRSTLGWDEGDIARSIACGPRTSKDAKALYAHIDATLGVNAITGARPMAQPTARAKTRAPRRA